MIASYNTICPVLARFRPWTFSEPISEMFADTNSSCFAGIHSERKLITTDRHPEYGEAGMYQEVAHHVRVPVAGLAESQMTRPAIREHTQQSRLPQRKEAFA